MVEAILVTGSGSTTRANVEAMIDDYFYPFPEAKIYLAIHGAVTEAQVWLTQYAIDKKKEIIAYQTDGAQMMGIPTTVERVVSDEPIKAIIDLGLKLDALVFWNDEDIVSLNALALCKENGIEVRDFTEGLNIIHPVEGIKSVEPSEIPESEKLPAVEPEVEFEPEEDEDDEEYEDPLYEAINVVAKIFAEAIAQELRKVLKK